MEDPVGLRARALERERGVGLGAPRATLPQAAWVGVAVNLDFYSRKNGLAFLPSDVVEEGVFVVF